ncbi:MAG: hypothetical protein KIT84_38635 [Labilithrix sp.]|nr:hypothetical protein [Labilithrix sp.]MCW5816978.1 hypothetical protein [Labilithrix sp.]
MKRAWLLPFVLAVACAPEIKQDDPPPEAIFVKFDPGAEVPVVPTPNDLAKDATTGLLVVSSNDATPLAQREFNTDYLGGLNGFPYESTAEVLLSGALDPETVDAESVVVLDLTDGGAPVTTVTPRYDETKIAISIAAPAGGWTRAHRYAIAVIGGSSGSGVKGAKGQRVIGSPAWVLVSGKFPLFECDPANPDECKPAVDIIPSSKTDPAEKFADQVAKAKRLDQLRQGYAPLLESIAQAKQVAQTDIPVVWTFTIVDAAEPTFDPGSRVIPFPNDAVRTGPDGTVALPNPTTGEPLTPEDCAKALSDPKGDRQVQLTCGLNTLDGFSTQTAPVSENSAKLGALQQDALIDPATLGPDTVGLVAVAPGVPAGARTTPRITPCLNCLSSADESGTKQTLPQQLQLKLEAPLDEKTTYLAYVTRGVKDDKGTPLAPPPAFAFIRSRTSLVDGDKPTLSNLTIEQAKRLEPLRLAMEPALDALEAEGGPKRADLALAWIFTTQSEASTLEQLAEVPAKATGLPAGPVAVRDVTAQLSAVATAGGIPIDGIAKFFAGSFLTPVLVTSPSGAFDPAKPVVHRVDFLMTVPSSPAPAGGYPTTIFGHGFTRSRNDALPIANALAKAGQVTIASDVLFHGDRTSCTGSQTATKQTTDDAACADPATQRCNGEPVLGLCVARNDAARNPCAPGPSGDGFCAGVGQGRCASDLKCQAGDLARDPTGKPLISGWNMFSLTNFFATRDNFRQQVIDLSQLVRVIKSPGPTGLAGQSTIALDGTKLGYVGQSMGGILGTLFNAVSPDTTHVVLNVPGGALPQIILNAPSFAEQKAALLETLADGGIKPGTPEFDQFLGVIQWILDPADPANMGYRLTHGIDVSGTTTPNANRKAFIQFIEGDQTVPNISNFALVRAAANKDFDPTSAPGFGCVAPLFCYEFTEAGDSFTTTSVPLTARHGFLLAPTALTAKAQTQAATFLATGKLP